MARRVLLLLSQSTHDLTSGAAMSMRGIARTLANAGFSVRALATTAVEGPAAVPALPLLGRMGVRPEVDRRGAVGKGRPVLRFTQHGVSYALLDTGAAALKDWDFAHGLQFNRLLMNELEKHPPEIVLTMGGAPPDQARRQMARASGAAVVFGLRSLAYLHPLAFDNVDAVVTPGEFVSARYREAIGLRSTPIPPPLDPVETVAPAREAKWFTFVNPSPSKGVYFFATLVAELAQRRPDIPLLVLETRGRGEHLLQAGRQGGYDLSRHPNLRIEPTRLHPRDVFADCRALLLPSLWEEPFGRLAMEALHNGVPTVHSGRGGLGEAAGEGGIEVPILKGITPRTDSPVTPGAVAEWAEMLIRLQDDAAFYEQACGRARASTARYDPAEIARRYVEFFTGLAPSASPVVVRTNSAPGATQVSGRP